MVTNCKTLKEWEDFGLLAELPEDRKQMTVDCYNIAMKWLIDAPINVNDKIIGEIEPLILPVFYRIAKVVDLTETEVLDTCKEFRESWLSFDPTKLINVGDPELHFVKSFAENKINQIKNK
jgi:hypothetical protein